MAFGMYASVLDTMARTAPKNYDIESEYTRMRDAFVVSTMQHVGTELWNEGLQHAPVWYPLAHAVAVGMTEYGLSRIQSSLIVAAQSINCQWTVNEVRAMRVAKLRTREGVPSAANKTIAALDAGIELTIEDALRVLNGQKIMRFFLNILTCEDEIPSDDVTLDRFMARGCETEQRQLKHGIVYDTMDRAFRDAMDIVSGRTGVTFDHYYEWQAFTWGLFRGSYF
jgi:hypothetical protein